MSHKDTKENENVIPAPLSVIPADAGISSASADPPEAGKSRFLNKSGMTKKSVFSDEKRLLKNSNKQGEDDAGYC